MKIDLGNGTELDLQRLITSKLLIQANSGGGKSWMIRRLLEQTHGHVQQIVIDVEDEFYTLREKFDYVLARHDEGDCVPEVRSAELLATRLLELGVNAIVSIYELSPRDRREFVKRFLDALTNAPRSLWHPVLLVLDESHEFCPEVGKGRDTSGGCSDAVILFMSKGRKRGFCGVLATQRISKLHKDAAAECNNKLIGRATLDLDRKRAAEELGFSAKSDVLSLRKLEPGEFFAFGPAISDEVIRFRSGPVKTTHPKAGAAPTPVAPPKSKVKSVLSKLADLPQEAEQERATIDSLKRDLAQVRGELRQAQNNLAKTPQTKIEEKRVDVPILKAKDAGKIEAAGKTFATASARAIEVGEELLSLLKKGIPEGSRLVFERGTAEVRQPTLFRSKVTIERARTAAHTPAPAAPAPEKAAAPVRAGELTISGPMQKILNTLASFEALGVTEADRNQIALFSGASPTSSSYANNLSDLRKPKDRETKEPLPDATPLIDYLGGGKLKLTDAGRAIAVNDALFGSLDELHSTWIGKVGGACGKILRALIDAYPNPLTKEELAVQVGASPTSSSFANNLSTLRGLGVIDYPGRGLVIATPLLFPPI